MKRTLDTSKSNGEMFFAEAREAHAFARRMREQYKVTYTSVTVVSKGPDHGKHRVRWGFARP